MVGVAFEWPAARSQIVVKGPCLLAQRVPASHLLQKGTAGVPRHQAGGRAGDGRVTDPGEVAVDLQRRFGAAGLAKVARQAELRPGPDHGIPGEGESSKPLDRAVEVPVAKLGFLGGAEEARRRLR